MTAPEPVECTCGEFAGTSVYYADCPRHNPTGPVKTPATAPEPVGLTDGEREARLAEAERMWLWTEPTDESVGGYGPHMAQMIYRLPHDSQTWDMRASINGLIGDLGWALDRLAAERAAHEAQVQAGDRLREAVERMAARAEADRDECVRWINDPTMHVDPGHPSRLSDAAADLNKWAGRLRTALAAAAPIPPQECICSSPHSAAEPLTLRQEVEKLATEWAAAATERSTITRWAAARKLKRLLTQDAATEGGRAQP